MSSDTIILRDLIAWQDEDDGDRNCAAEVHYI